MNFPEKTIKLIFRTSVPLTMYENILDSAEVIEKSKSDDKMPSV